MFMVTCFRLTKKGATYESPFHRLVWFIVIFATKWAQSTQVVTEELQIDKAIATSVTKARIALCTDHMITATFPLNEYLENNI